MKIHCTERDKGRVNGGKETWKTVLPKRREGLNTGTKG